jgi:hypothetical protein
MYGLSNLRSNFIFYGQLCLHIGFSKGVDSVRIIQILVPDKFIFSLLYLRGIFVHDRWETSFGGFPFVFLQGEQFNIESLEGFCHFLTTFAGIASHIVAKCSKDVESVGFLLLLF